MFLYHYAVDITYTEWSSGMQIMILSEKSQGMMSRKCYIHNSDHR